MSSTDNETPTPRKPGLIRRTIRRRWLAILAC